MSLTLTSIASQGLRSNPVNRLENNDKNPKIKRQLSTFQTPTNIFTPTAGFGKMGETLYGSGAGMSAFCTSPTDASPRLYVVKGSTAQLVESGTTTTSLAAPNIVAGPNGNAVLLYTQQQGSAIKVYARTVSSSLSLGSKIEIGTAATNTKYVTLIQIGSNYMVIWNRTGNYQAQPVTSSLQPTGSLISNYGTDPNFPSSLGDIMFHPITFLKEASVAGPKYILRKSDGIYTGTATTTGIGSQTKISPTGAKFSSPDIIKGADGTIIAAWGQHTSDNKNVVYAQKISSSLTAVGSPVVINSNDIINIDPLQVQLGAFSDGYLAVTSSYGVYFNALHLSPSLELRGSAQSLSSGLSPTGSFDVQVSSSSFNIAFLGRTSSQNAFSTSPSLYNLPGTFSLPTGTSPTAAPTPSSGNNPTRVPTPDTKSNKPTKSPTANNNLVGTSDHPYLLGNPGISETFTGYCNGETIMDGGSKQKTNPDTFIVLPCEGSDVVTNFRFRALSPGGPPGAPNATIGDRIDLSKTSIKSFEGLISHAVDPASMLYVDFPKLIDDDLGDAFITCAMHCPSMYQYGEILCIKNGESLHFEIDGRSLKIDDCLRPDQVKFSNSNQESTSTTPIVMGVILGFVALLATIFAVYKCLNHKSDAKVNPNEQPR